MNRPNFSPLRDPRADAFESKTSNTAFARAQILPFGAAGGEGGRASEYTFSMAPRDAPVALEGVTLSPVTPPTASGLSATAGRKPPSHTPLYDPHSGRLLRIATHVSTLRGCCPLRGCRRPHRHQRKHAARVPATRWSAAFRVPCWASAP